MTTTSRKEPPPPSETPSDPPEETRYDPAEVWESALLRGALTGQQLKRQQSSQKSPPHLRLVKRQ